MIPPVITVIAIRDMGKRPAILFPCRSRKSTSVLAYEERNTIAPAGEDLVRG